MASIIFTPIPVPEGAEIIGACGHCNGPFVILKDGTQECCNCHEKDAVVYRKTYVPKHLTMSKPIDKQK